MLPSDFSGDILVEMQDAELLQAYRSKGDESAFSELVRRYVDLVYSTALRHVGGESSLAEDVTQRVFQLLAQKSGGLLGHPSLAGWLYHTTGHVAARTQRTETRRRARELEAAQMNMNDSHSSELDHILPLLEDAMKGLNESDRLVLLLRFFMKQPMHEVGQALGVSEAAAKMRVARAVERLRVYFVKRGVSCTSAAVALALAQQTLQAAPLGLAAKVMSGLSAASLATAPSLVGAFILMTKTKIITIVCALACLGMFTAGIRHLISDRSLPRAPTETQHNVTTPKGTGGDTPIRRIVDRHRLSAAMTPSSIAAERLRAALAAPSSKSPTLWPDEEVIRQVKAFPDRRAAFELLKAAVANPAELLGDSPNGADLEYLVRLRAIRSMQYLASDVPEVGPFLWDTFKSDDVGTKANAFSTLQSIGFRSDDLSKLVESLPGATRSPALVRFIPQAISNVIARDPQAAAPAIAALEQLLVSPDATLRFSAACALAGTRLDQDQRISEILGATLQQSDSSRVLTSVEALAKAGPKAAAFVPTLLELSRKTPEEYLRAEYLRAVAAIDPGAAATEPDVAKVLAHDAQVRDLARKFEAESASVEELMSALKFPQHTTAAAVRLGEMGMTASKAAPVLIKALEGQDEAARDQIVDALSRIDPKIQIERVDARTIANAVIHAEISLSAEKSNNFEDPVTRFIMDKRKFSTWWTRDEVISVATKLAALDRTAYAAFTEKILEAYPDLGPQWPSF